MIKATRLIFCLMILASCVFAQNGETTKNSQIVAVNTDAFYDENSGIPEFVKVSRQLEIEFKSKIEEFDVLSANLTALVKERNTALAKEGNEEKPYFYHCFKNPSEEFEKIVKLHAELKLKGTELQNPYLERKAELSKDLTKKVSQALEDFAKENKYLIVLDGSEENSSAIIQGEIINVTKEFIQFYNERFANQKSQ